MISFALSCHSNTGNSCRRVVWTLWVLTFRRPCCYHIPTWCTWTRQSRKKGFPNQTMGPFDEHMNLVQYFSAEQPCWFDMRPKSCWRGPSCTNSPGPTAKTRATDTDDPEFVWKSTVGHKLFTLLLTWWWSICDSFSKPDNLPRRDLTIIPRNKVVFLFCIIWWFTYFYNRPF